MSKLLNCVGTYSFLMLISMGLGVSANAAAQTYKSTYAPTNTSATTGYSDYTNLNTSGYKYALGYQDLAIGNGVVTGFGMLHGMTELSPNAWVGLGIGGTQSFDNFVIAPDLRYILKAMGSTDLFANLNLAFVKFTGGAASNTGFQLGTFVGVSYGLTAFLRASFAYGLHFDFGDVFQAKFAITNRWQGTFGLHWYF